MQGYYVSAYKVGAMGYRISDAYCNRSYRLCTECGGFLAESIDEDAAAYLSIDSLCRCAVYWQLNALAERSDSA
jgi:hypothetical protein